jgi:plastocyanin
MTVHMVYINAAAGGGWFYDPADLSVKTGDAVAWKNNTAVPHTATSDDGTSFDTGNIAVGATSATQTINNNPGLLPYHCTYHANMKGMLTVS